METSLLDDVHYVSDLGDFIVPATLRVVSDLRIADHLRDGPRKVTELAELTGAHPRALLRALRVLAARGIFRETDPENFELTRRAQLLRGDHPFSLRDGLTLLSCDVEAFARFDHSVRTNEASFDHVHGEGYWEWMSRHPDESARFDATQQGATRLELRASFAAYDWSELGSIADIGGGNGAFLAGLLSRYRSLKGCLFDLPHVVEGAPRILDKAGVTERCEIRGGSFFEAVPAGYDAYLMKRILYSWPDDKVRAVLRTVRAAMREDSRMLLIEPMETPGNAREPGKVYDLLMLALGGGSARSEDHLAALFDEAGLRLERVVPTLMYPIVEARPR
ncbi:MULTISPECIES: methyltransferase [unclassified Streptomyces]|uniref:methyltransferase n=1 Tax=unclassified Streptomyces TaxID=2593676 RepID=UPI00037BAFE8|nr:MULTISPECIES: methyltransferase [unclassified Streptomyces]MYT29253.1 methyltransferase [Streptomyces sp. SID8354]